MLYRSTLQLTCMCQIGMLHCVAQVDSMHAQYCMSYVARSFKLLFITVNSPSHGEFTVMDKSLKWLAV